MEDTSEIIGYQLLRKMFPKLPHLRLARSRRHRDVFVEGIKDLEIDLRFARNKVGPILPAAVDVAGEPGRV